MKMAKGFRIKKVSVATGSIDILSKAGRMRSMRLNDHKVTVVEPVKLISFKKGQKKLIKMLSF